MDSNGGSSSSSSKLEETFEFTPTWVVATVCTVIVVISLFAERFLHFLGKFLLRKKQDALFEALQKLKEELMLLGFISLLLTISQNLISHICIPPNASIHFIPCRRLAGLHSEEGANHINGILLEARPNGRRLLSEGADSHPCKRKGKVPMLSLEALHQLHIFIFVLATVHVVFCATTMVLGGAKISQWKHWEKEIRNHNIEKGEGEVQAHHEFVKERASGNWRKLAIVVWMMSFFKQFYASVTKSDYTALRSGFIMRHCSSNINFDFHKYMMRALEDDFRMVVGISWHLWLFVVIFLLLNVKGWHAYFWLSFLPLILLLAVGTKLEHIITTLAQEVSRKQPTDPESPWVKPSDHHFWFHRPGTILYLIHFILFQNAFELAFFIWVWTTYGFKSCIIEKIEFTIPRIIIGLIVQVLCSYSTLPLYAIVTQMGDMFKQAIFAEQLRLTLHDWAEAARKRKRTSSSGGSTFRKFFSTKTKKRDKSEIGVHMQEKNTFEAGGSSHSSQGLPSFAGVLNAAIQNSQTQE